MVVKKLLQKWFMVGVAGVYSSGLFAQNSTKNGIAGVVNEEAITLQEIQRYTHMEEQDLRNQQIAGKISKEEMAKKIRERWSIVLDSLIEKKLILQDYKKKGYSFPDYFFDRAEKQQIRDQYGGDRQALLKTLEEQGRTLAEWKKDSRETFIVQQMRIINAKKYITISPHMIENYYQENVRDFLKPERVKMRMLYLAPGNGVEAESKAKDLYQRVVNGEDFESLAKKYSNYNPAGGGLFIRPGVGQAEGTGWLTRSDGLSEEIADVAFRLRPGQSSELISLPTADGRVAYYILHVEDVQKATVIPLDRLVRDQIENTLQARESEKVQGEWIARLKRDAFIEKPLLQ